MLRTRVFTALVLLSLVLAALWLGRVAFVALAALSKSATPARVKQNATSDHIVVAPMIKKTRLK